MTTWSQDSEPLVSCKGRASLRLTSVVSGTGSPMDCRSKRYRLWEFQRTISGGLCTVTPRAPSATSRELLCKMIDHLTAKVVTDATLHFLSGEQTGRFNDGPFTMHPMRLNAVEPGTFGRQPARNDAHSRMALTLGCQHAAIVLLEPTAHFFTHVPGGVIPDEDQHALALALHLLAEPLQKSRRHMADGPTIDKAQPDRLALGFQHAIATQGFGVGILFADLPFQQAQRLSRLTPAMHLGLSHATPPHLIGIPHHPATPFG